MTQPLVHPKAFSLQIFLPSGDPQGVRIIDRANWTGQGVAFTTKDNSLDKASVQHLESRLVELANAAGRCSLENAVTPSRPSLLEAHAAGLIRATTSNGRENWKDANGRSLNDLARLEQRDEIAL